jgi:hypothetical protein
MLAVEGATSGFTINGWWIAVSLLNFAIGIALIVGVVLLVRWLVVSRPRQAREQAELRERLARLEAAQLAGRETRVASSEAAQPNPTGRSGT